MSIKTAESDNSKTFIFRRYLNFSQYKIYFFYFYLFFLINLLFPEVIHDSKFYGTLYSQKNYFSYHFDFCKFSIFISTFIFGYFLTISKNHAQVIVPNKENIQSFVLNFSVFIFISIIFFFTSGYRLNRKI
jgi:hypothetical protein